jgi:pyrroloquinoline-quinone synthase
MHVIAALDSEVAGRRLLDHPFYQRWTAGTLSLDELRDYARQYYHYAAAFPTFLSAIHAHTDDLEARQYLLENLIEEEHGPDNHPELWLRFCEALGLDRGDVLAGAPNDGMRNLIATMRSLAAAEGLVPGLAALYAYESQVPAVAAAKIDGLARWYGIDDARSIAFFTVHQTADVHHAQTSRELLARHAGAGDAAREAASRTLGALYGFLDALTH